MNTAKKYEKIDISLRENSMICLNFPKTTVRGNSEWRPHEACAQQWDVYWPEMKMEDDTDTLSLPFSECNYDVHKHSKKVL